ncbi:MAG: anthranilate synthase component I family protein [Roseivirga sp.]|nr:anthranilate synthase component I family protein [Roseivirga sp.]
MLRQQTEHTLVTKQLFIEQALQWADQFSHVAYYHHNDIPYPHKGFQEIIAIGCEQELNPLPGDRFESLRAFHQNDWLFGYLGYDLKNDTEAIESNNPDLLDFPEMAFFKARHILFFDGNKVTIDSDDETVFEKIISTPLSHQESSFSPVKASMTRDTYLDITQKLRMHIEEGDCYEINFCQEFHGDIIEAHPATLFLELSRISPKPFASFQKWNSQYILSASPERFMKKTGTELISQPIKGTRPRGSSAAEDKRLAHELRHDEKELAENMMIVDLVRNDLARSSQPGSVKVEELFGIYQFEQVFQMISTVRSELRSDHHFIDAIKNAFPMGSMTGAPKVKVMELIEQYENTKRGAFSGAAGYISPDGDFDFNVMIRSLFLDLQKRLYSFQVGSAITYDAIPENEYDECLVKAKAIMQLLSASDQCTLLL